MLLIKNLFLSTFAFQVFGMDALNQFDRFTGLYASGNMVEPPNKDPLTLVPASSQLGVATAKVKSVISAVENSVHSVLDSFKEDSGELFVKNFIRTEAHRQATKTVFTYFAYAWILMAGAVLTFLVKMAFYPRLKSWWLGDKRRASTSSEYSSDEDTSSDEDISPISRKFPPKALLPSTADARIAYEAQAYTSS